MALVVKKLLGQCRRHERRGSIPGAGRFPGGGNGAHSSMLSRRAHGQRSLEGYSPWGRRVGHSWSHLAHSTHSYVEPAVTTLVSVGLEYILVVENRALRHRGQSNSTVYANVNILTCFLLCYPYIIPWDKVHRYILPQSHLFSAGSMRSIDFTMQFIKRTH